MRLGPRPVPDPLGRLQHSPGLPAALGGREENGKGWEGMRGKEAGKGRGDKKRKREGKGGGEGMGPHLLGQVYALRGKGQSK